MLVKFTDQDGHDWLIDPRDVFAIRDGNYNLTTRIYTRPMGTTPIVVTGYQKWVHRKLFGCDPGSHEHDNAARSAREGE